MPRRAWTEEEYVVLIAIFTRSDFSAGDDSSPVCMNISIAFGRVPGTIDRQWRNIKDLLNNKNVGKIGAGLSKWTTYSLYNPQNLQKLALEYCEKNQWPLAKYLE